MTPEELLSASSPVVEDPSEIPAAIPAESFSDLLAEFEHTHRRRAEGESRQIEGSVVSIDAESVYVDIGYKTEGILPRSAFPDNAPEPAAGDKLLVSVKGRNPEGYYELSRVRVAQPTDWASLQDAFTHKTPVAGTVTGAVKGGLTVDIGVRAFMPASRSGARDAAEMEKLVGQEIACRIVKLDVTEEDVVVDRRVVAEEQANLLQQSRISGLREGDIVSGHVRSLVPYGAFVDVGGVDGLLHIGDMAWSRVENPEDVLSVGQQLELKILSIDPEKKRISLGLKQLQPEPWLSAAEKYAVGQRITGAVTRLTDFGAFVELEPGIEGMIHVSEMSWVKKVRKPSDMLKLGDTVDAVILSISAGERRISLGLKQALGDPWEDVPKRFAVGAAVEGPVVRLTKFGAFVQLTEGVEGLVHISEITAERHLHHPEDVLRVGQMVKAQVLAVDPEKRQIRLSMKRLVPTGLAEYLEEHKAGDLVSGRVVELSSQLAAIELGEGVRATCPVAAPAPAAEKEKSSAGPDLSSLTSMLSARWKSGAAPSQSRPEALAIGQVRSFRIVKLDPGAETIEVELA